MSYTRKIAHNTIIQIAGKAISTVIGMVVIGMLTRYLGESGFGQYYTIMIFLQLFGVLVDLGLYIILVKRISEPGVDESRLTSNIFTLRLISAVLFLGLAPVIVLFFPYAAIVKVGVLITSFSFLAITLNQALSGVFQKHLRMDRVVISELVGRVVLIGFTWYAISANLGLLAVMAAVVAGSIANFLLTFIFVRQLVKIKLAFDWRLWREIIYQAWPIALSIAFNLIYLRGDAIILSLYHHETAVGIYGAPNKVLEVLVTFPAMFAGLVLPLLTAAWALADREKFKRILNKSFDAMIILAVPLMVGTWFVAKPIMNLLAPNFHQADALLRILIIATSIIFVGNLFGNTVVALNRQKSMMWLYLLVAIFSLIGYFVFIPRYSYFGAAWVRTASELAITIAASWLVLRITRVRLDLKVFLKVILASGLMALAMYWLRSINFILLILVGCAVYLLALLAFRVVNRETLREITRIN
ncbi:MAG: flippase [Patescibacteria group bacterium]|jgi:O-antigen/teichoic acid export membrane protein